MATNAKVAADVYITVTGKNYSGYESDPYDFTDAANSGLIHVSSTLTERQVNRGARVVSEYFRCTVEYGIMESKISPGFEVPRELKDCSATL